jgi:hypothetical protein
LSRARGSIDAIHQSLEVTTPMRLSHVVLSVVAIAGCADATSPVRLVEPRFSGSLNAPGHLIIGSGHVEQAAGLREFTFHAIEQPDGSVSGSYKIVLANGLFFETDVTCMATDENTGWIAGTIRATNAAAVVVGSISTVFAIDNGDGVGSADVVSIATFNGAAGGDLAFCTNRPLVLPQLTVTDGNVQVR